jgi:hypothetical protein
MAVLWWRERREFENMQLNIDEIKDAMNIINKQITNKLLSKPNAKVKVALDAIDTLWLIHENETITITGPLTEEIQPKVPSWITFETESDKFRIIADANPYAPELAFFLTEVWKEMKLDDSTLLEHHVGSALELIEGRWKLTGEPLNKPNQRGLIGEIEAIMHSFDIKGDEAVEGWDHTSHALHDLKGDGWAIEAKSIGESSDSVSISSLNQLKWNKGVNLILSVTTVSEDQTEDGKTLPEYIDNRVGILKSKNADSASKLLLKLQAIGFNQVTRSRYTSTWKIPSDDDTCFYSIEEDSPTNWWSNKEVKPQMPEEIIVSKYRLDLSTKVFEATPLKDILD